MPGVHQPDPPGLIHDDLRLLPPWRGSSLFSGVFRHRGYVGSSRRSCGTLFSHFGLPGRSIHSSQFIHRFGRGDGARVGGWPHSGLMSLNQRRSSRWSATPRLRATSTASRPRRACGSSTQPSRPAARCGRPRRRSARRAAARRCAAARTAAARPRRSASVTPSPAPPTGRPPSPLAHNALSRCPTRRRTCGRAVRRRRAAARGRPARAVLAVIGGRGGAGASVFATALAHAPHRRALLIDVDPWGGGIDLALGSEHDAGPALAGPRAAGRPAGLRRAARRASAPARGQRAVG